MKKKLYIVSKSGCELMDLDFLHSENLQIRVAAMSVVIESRSDGPNFVKK